MQRRIFILVNNNFMGRRVYVTASEIEAIRQALDFIEHNIDGAEDDFYNYAHDGMIKPLQRLRNKYYRL